MPSSFSSRDSPRNSHARRRPTRGQLARSGSLLGAIKNIVTAPLTWFSSQEDFEDVPGKRRRNPNAVERDEGAYDEDRPTAKRKRVDSPEPAHAPQQPPTRTFQGYLDVPEGLIPRQTAPRQRLTTSVGYGRSSSFTPSISVPAVPEAHLARRTASPAIATSYSQPAAIHHTQSMDPPAYRPISLSRDVSMEGGMIGSANRDVTMSPSRQAFQLRSRSSLTPQPSGQAFGPTPQNKGRDASEPPPLASLVSKPVFVKPPPQHQQPYAEHPVTTLGSIVESKGHTSRSPMRQHSSLFLGSRASIAESSSTSYMTSVNAAEKALRDLDVYKTPLLPSRLRGSQTIPDMFKPKKMQAPVLMRSEREHKPRLGTSEKLKEEEHPTAAKPYAGRGGMKKMLAKRKLEEQEEQERERANAIETDLDEEADGPHKQPTKRNEEVQAPEKVPDVTIPPAEPAPVRPTGGLSKARNRFSAAFDDDEGDDAILDETREQEPVEEPQKLPTLFESPKGFTFAQEKTPIQAVQDTSKAKEPPISALPFSLTKSGSPSAAPSAAATLPFSFGEPPKKLPSPLRQPRSLKAQQKLLLPRRTNSSHRPAPAKSKSESSASTTTSTPSSVPNFFVNSSIFSKPGVNIAPPVPASATSQRSTTETTGKADAAGPSATAPQTSNASTPFSFGGSGAPSLVGNEPQTGTQQGKETSGDEATKPAQPSLFGSSSSSSPFSFGTSPAPPAANAPAPFSFGTPASNVPKESATTQHANSTSANRPALPAFEEPKLAPSAPTPAPVSSVTAPASQPFSFGAPARPAEPAAPPLSAFTFGASSSTTTTAAPAASASPFSFGAPKTEPAKEPENKPLFGASEPAKPSLFGAPAPTPSPFGGSQPGSATAESAPKSASPFTFGQPTQATTPAIEAPKPLFPSTSGGSGGFSFGASAPSSAVPQAAPAKSPFSFGASPATPPVTSATENKPAFTFGASAPAPQVSAPTTLFGGPSSGSNGADVSNKPFAFGAPPRAATPPRQEQEMRMEESPTRGGGMDVNGQEQKPSSGFSFGALSGSSGVSPFGQTHQSTSSPFSFGVKSEPKPETRPAAPFSFGTSTSSGGGFGFGQKPPDNTQSPISPAPFGSSAPFGAQSSGTPTTNTPAFGFGAQNATSGGGFGQPASSTPASPSTFGQPAPFSFGTPTSATAPSNPFAFGSQPASPATGNAGLPQPPGSSSGPSFAFGQPSPATTQSPASPFGAAPPAPGGGVAFTMGSAAPQQQAPGARAIKKLPNHDTIARMVNGSDASSFAHICGCCPSQVWGVIWLIQAFAFFAAGILVGIVAFKEMRAIADGVNTAPRVVQHRSSEDAAVDVLDIIALNARSEIALGQWDDGCTALAWTVRTGAGATPPGGPRKQLLAQNWDWREAVGKNLALASIAAPGKPRMWMVIEVSTPSLSPGRVRVLHPPPPSLLSSVPARFLLLTPLVCPRRRETPHH
ncbi:hypothetical protein BD413DRAFT_608371 [Trametes elegans]|nr:hypothetical protein BD413DRAFT_608371 [Trametes elegans]